MRHRHAAPARSGQRPTRRAPAPAADAGATAAFLPEAVTVAPRHLEVGDAWVASFAVTGYPREVQPGWLQPLLTYPGRLDVALHIEPIDPVDAARYISRRDGSVLMEEYCRTWPDTLDVGHLRDKAIRSRIWLYIVPRWGETSVGNIKPSMYRAWEKWLHAQPNIGNGREIKGVFSMMMDDAVDDGLRAASPVQRRRRRGKYVKKQRETRRRWRCRTSSNWLSTGWPSGDWRGSSTTSPSPSPRCAPGSCTRCAAVLPPLLARSRS
ncbi:hypothetical protein [Streptomyces chrestomyceticus]|uniref:hypothetical protein n=1 Tax=Streptomyces chrestomyceticus TaxID=68185 RepID=UPI0033FD0AEB